MGHAQFDEAYMGTDRELKGSGIPGFGHSNRSPQSSRVSKTTRKVKSGPNKKGLPRTTVVVKRVNPRKWEVYSRNPSDQRLIAVIERHHMGYGYQIMINMTREDAALGRRPKPHGGFATLKACTEALLLKL